MSRKQSWLLCAARPAVIPAIVGPLDRGVDALMDVTVRPVLRWLVCQKVGSTTKGLEICSECSL